LLVQASQVVGDGHTSGDRVVALRQPEGGAPLRGGEAQVASIVRLAIFAPCKFVIPDGLQAKYRLQRGYLTPSVRGKAFSISIFSIAGWI